MWAFYVPSMACVILACGLLLRRYASPTVPWGAKVLVLLGWLTSVSIIALVPIDVWSTIQHTTNLSINIMWSISYWSTQALTWVLIPLAQGFYDAGDFNFIGRLRSSIKDRIVYFSSIGLAAALVVGLLLFMGKLSFKDLLPWAMVLANTYGLVAGILLLGFGLVAIPRQVWRQSDPEASLRYALYRVGRAAERLEDATLEMQMVAAVVEATSQTMSKRDPLRAHMDIIYRQAEMEAPMKPSQAARDDRGRVNLDELTDRDLDYGVDERGLARLRRRLTYIINKYTGLRSQYGSAVADGIDLEAICIARKSMDFFAMDAAGNTLQQAWMMFRCMVNPWLQKAIALVLAANSFMLVWSEATIGSGTSPNLSPFSHMIGHGVHGEVATQLLTALPLAYMCVSAYYSLFKLGMFSFYQVLPHATDPVSLLLNAGQVCRFAAPLAYNFLHVIRMNEKTVFAVKMGAAMDNVMLPFFGADFNTWFPLTVVIYCGLLYLNIWDAVVGICLPKRFRFSEDQGDDEHTERGRQLLRQEQDAKRQGVPVGECLGLWGSAEAPGLSSAASDRLAARRLGQGGGLARGLQTDRKSPRTLPSSVEIEQPHAAPVPVASVSKWGWSRKQPSPVVAAKSPSPSRTPSRRGSQSGGASHSRSASASGKGNQLDDIFSRMSPDGGGGIGRIDDDDDDEDESSRGFLGGERGRDSPRTSWNKSWR